MMQYAAPDWSLAAIRCSLTSNMCLNRLESLLKHSNGPANQQTNVRTYADENSKCG